MSLMVSFLVQLLYATSQHTYDAAFTAAHMYKAVSYSFALVGLLMSMFIAFEEVEEARDKINAILKSIGDGVFAVDIHGNIVLINKVAERLSGVPQNEALGQHYTKVFTFTTEDNPSARYPDFVKSVIETGSATSLQQRTLLTNREGKVIPVSDSAAPIQDNNGVIFGCIVVIRDVTHERELERTKDDFLSVASHQLRTPLGSMRWNMEMLLSGEMGKLPNSAKEVVSQIYESIHRLVLLVNDLLSVSRIDQKRVTDRPQKTDIASVFDSVKKELEAETVKHAVTVTVNKKGTIPSVVIDPNRLHEVFLNLTSNAIKYNRPHGTVTVTISTNTQDIIVEIADTGIGIPEKDQERLFSKFFRATNATSSAANGSGLGLFVVQSYIESWGGSISFKSIEGTGTTFTLHIPKKPNTHTLDSNLQEHPHTAE